MKTSLTLIAVVSLVLVLATVGFAKSSPRRIKFKPGATKASVTGRLNGWNDKARFVIRVLAGQTMRLSVESKCADCYPTVAADSPAGANDSQDSDMCQCRVQVSNTAAGDYFITVGESRKADRGWKGDFVLKVEVK